MTESYDPYSNAVTERVNEILKPELITLREGINLSEIKTVYQSINI